MTFRVGVVGIGDISDVYLNNLKKYPMVQVIGCAGRDPGKARAKAALHDLPKAYTGAAELLDDPEVDLVLDLTTPGAHHALNMAALRAGKHVYTEKPLAGTFAEGKELMALARARGLRVGCAPDTFLGGRLQTCRDIIDSGRIGAVTGASAFVVSHGPEWHHPSPGFLYQPGAGPVLDVGPYYVTALTALLGPARRCCAMGKRTFPSRTLECGPLKGTAIPVRVDTHLTASIEFASGAIVTLLASFDVWDSELPRIEIYGTEGTLCIGDLDPVGGPNLFGGKLLLRTRDEYRWQGLPRTNADAPWLEVPVTRPFNELSHRDDSRGIGLVDLACAIRDGRPHRANGDLALHGLELMEAILTSATEGRFQSLESSCARPEPLPLDFPEAPHT
jgi:predicted dehydrogenase